MEITTARIRQVITFSLLLLSINCFSQNHESNISAIYGNWKCVKHDYNGPEIYSLKQAEMIRKSILHIEENTYYFDNIGFIQRCSFHKLKIEPYDTSRFIERLRVIYTNNDLKKMFTLDPVDKNAKLSCYNNCSLMLNADTLISNCGGDIFYWIKTPGIIKDYKGKGSTEIHVPLSGSNRIISLTYNFYSEPDQLIIEDQSGRQLFTTGMTTTNGEKQLKIPISNVSKLTFKVNSGQPSSIWSFKVKVE